MTQQIIRYPRLNTILMLEEFIQSHDGEFKKKQLWNNLPKKMMYQTYSLALDYLILSNKISVDLEGKIGWIFYPEDLKKRLNQIHLFWNKHEKFQSPICK
ncbi:MAG: hypothetical protein PHX15_02940 [Candidatus Nanoarchaeia archaeon]|nr:hypothetical protein [Candidatus Nanoarchaeia archaeon]